jgi:DNA-binding NarL/FixJ family response regulator
VDDSTAVRSAIGDFIEVTTPYKVCGAAADGVSAIEKATQSGCDVILLHLRAPAPESVETALLLRSKLPHVKIVGFSTLSVDSENWASPATGFDAVLAKKDGLSKLVETLKALMPASAPEPTKG